MDSLEIEKSDGGMAKPIFLILFIFVGGIFYQFCSGGDYMIPFSQLYWSTLTLIMFKMEGCMK